MITGDPGSARAASQPPTALTLDGKSAFGLGAALAIAMLRLPRLLQVCYLGVEVANPARTLPLAFLISAPSH
jgi:hypothetical protein